MSPPVIDLDLRLRVRDRARRFDLAVTLQSAAPVVALFGPSGAGKSLTLQSIAGLQRPDAGHVRVAGRTLFDAGRGIDLPPEQRGLGYLFQHYALFPHLSVRENIAFGLTRPGRRLDAAQAQRVEALLESFGLAPLAGSRPATLSGGQQQRVALARALACEPDLLLLDEPFAALNPLLRQGLRAELRALQQRTGVPLVLITHDIDDVLALADAAFVLEAGAVTRQIDLATLAHRDLARPLLLPGVAPAADGPRRGRLAQLLGLRGD